MTYTEQDMDQGTGPGHALPRPAARVTRRALLRACLRYGLLAGMGTGVYLAARRAASVDCSGMLCSNCALAGTCRTRPARATDGAVTEGQHRE